MPIQSLTLNTTSKLYELGSGTPKSVFQFVYDFAILGGTQGTIALTQTNGALPNNLIIQNAILDVLIPLGSGGAAVVGVSTGQGAGDLVAAAIAAGAPFSSTGPKVTIPLLGTIATWIKLTASRSPVVIVTIADLNAGKFNLFIEGILSA